MEWVMPVLTTIKGATPIDDISGLKIPVYSQAELHAAEAKNIARAVVKYLSKKPSARTAPFNWKWLCKLHGEMFGEVWEWAGKIRTGGTLNIGVATHQIAEELHKLLGDLRYWEKSDMTLAEQAARLHHRAVWIHPFPNGNGRWARLLADIWLKQHGEYFPVWPSDVNQESVIREHYITALRHADQGDISALLELQEEYGGK
jgi:Fic-DOC domain mobile mystery protein B